MPAVFDADPMLRRLERYALAFSAVAAVTALIVRDSLFGIVPFAAIARVGPVGETLAAGGWVLF